MEPLMMLIGRIFLPFLLSLFFFSAVSFAKPEINQAPRVLTFSEVTKLGEAQRSLYMKSLSTSLMEIEEREKKQSGKEAALESTESAFQVSQLQILKFLSLIEVSWAVNNCPPGYGRIEIPMSGQVIECGKRRESRSEAGAACEGNDTNMGTACLMSQPPRCTTYCQANPNRPGAQSAPAPAAPREPSAADICKLGGGQLNNQTCTCLPQGNVQYQWRPDARVCARSLPQGQRCLENESLVSPGVCRRGRSDQGSTPSTEVECLPRSCQVTREVNNDYRDRFRANPDLRRRCINAGMVTNYDYSVMRCPSISRASIGGFTTEACPARHTVCNPLVFGLKPDFKPICVRLGQATTRACAAASAEAGARSLFSHRPPGATEANLVTAWDEFREQFNSLCMADDISKNFHCVECGIIATRNHEFMNQLRQGSSANIPRSLCADVTPRSQQQGPGAQTPARPASSRAGEATR